MCNKIYIRTNTPGDVPAGDILVGDGMLAGSSPLAGGGVLAGSSPLAGGGELAGGSLLPGGVLAICLRGIKQSVMINTNIMINT